VEPRHVDGAVGQCGHVVGRPAVGLVALADVLVERHAGVALDRDVVVVVDDAEAAEALEPGQRRRLRGDALLEVAVTRDGPDAVVERAGALGGVRIEESPLVAGPHGHAHGGGESLAEGAGRGLDAGRVPVLGVAGRAAAPRAEGLEVGHGQAVVGQEELAVQGEAGVAGRQDETVAAEPCGVARIVAHDLLEQQVGGRGQAHRRAGMPVADALHGVGGDRTQVRDRTVVVGRPVEGCRGRARRCGWGHVTTLANAADRRTPIRRRE
jgi:hypothetical protein